MVWPRMFKMTRLQETSQTAMVTGSNDVRCEASRHCRNKNTEYVKDKFNDLATHSKSKNIRDMNRRINKF
jgi:hypothetical protein